MLLVQLWKNTINSISFLFTCPSTVPFLGMKPVRRIRRASHEVVELMGQSVENFSKIGKDKLLMCF